MKCEIIRDLMPLYLDGLTSEESNKAIGEHLDGCESCKEMLEQMKQETTVKTEETKKKINPFRKFNRKIKMYVAATLVVCVAFGGAFWKAFVKGWEVNPEDITMDVVLEDEQLWLQFELKNGHVLNVWGMSDQFDTQIGLKQMLHCPGDNRGEYPGRFEFGIDLQWLQDGILTEGATDQETVMGYPVTIDYGKEKVTYTLAELLEMAEE